MIKLTEILKNENSKMYYFAYGSNMRINEFEKQFNGAKAIGLVYLDNNKITFNKWSDTNSSSVADVVPETGTKVFGILYDFPKNQIDNLDKKEGGYKKITGKVTDSNGNDYKAFYYTVINKETEAIPNTKYIHYIVTGIKDGFDIDPKDFKGTPYRDELLKYTEWLKGIYNKGK